VVDAPNAPLILVVDDDGAFRDIVATVLRDAGYTVITAVDGAEALACMERRSPRLVLLNLVMPVLNGWALLAELEDRFPDAHEPIIVAVEDPLSCSPDALPPRVEAFIPKPVRIPDLLRAIRRLLPR